MWKYKLPIIPNEPFWFLNGAQIYTSMTIFLNNKF